MGKHQIRLYLKKNNVYFAIRLIKTIAHQKHMNRIYKNRYKAVTSVFFYLGSLVAILSLVGTSNTARNLYTQATGLKANLIVDTKGVIGTLNRHS